MREKAPYHPGLDAPDYDPDGLDETADDMFSERLTEAEEKADTAQKVAGFAVIVAIVSLFVALR